MAGCICVIARGSADDPSIGYFRREDGSYDWNIDPDCEYHRAAATEPWNHAVPWNCPTFWDGCNCPGGPFYYRNARDET
jgi:hypothetical protein